MDLRDPLNPTAPELPADITLPFGSVRVIIVLLNEDRMYAFPLGTDFFSLRRDRLLRSATDDLPFLLLRHRAAPAGYCPTRPLPGARVGPGALAAYRQSAPVAHAAIAVDLDEALDVLADLAPKLALYGVRVVDYFADARHVSVRQVAHLGGTIDLGLLADVACCCRPDAVDW